MVDSKDKNWMLEAIEEEERVEHGLPATPTSGQQSDSAPTDQTDCKED